MPNIIAAPLRIQLSIWSAVRAQATPSFSALNCRYRISATACFLVLSTITHLLLFIGPCKTKLVVRERPCPCGVFDLFKVVSAYAGIGMLGEEPRQLLSAYFAVRSQCLGVD